MAVTKPGYLEHVETVELTGSMEKNVPLRTHTLAPAAKVG